MKKTFLLLAFSLLVAFSVFAQSTTNDYSVLLGEKTAEKGTLIHLSSTTYLKLKAEKPFSKYELAICAKMNNVLRPVAVEQIFPETNGLTLNAEFFTKNQAKNGDWLVIRIYDEKSQRIEGHFEFQITD